MTVEENFDVTLLNPWQLMIKKRDATIHLPPLFPPFRMENARFKQNDIRNKYLGEYVKKITPFTLDPLANPNDLICVAIFGNFCELASIRTSKDTTWTHIAGMEINPKKIIFFDAVHYNNQFYALELDSHLSDSFKMKCPNLEILVFCGSELGERYKNKVMPSVLYQWKS